MLVTLCDIPCGWISCSRAQPDVVEVNSLYLGMPSQGPSETSHRFKADRRWSAPLFKNCSRNLPLRHLYDQFTCSRHYWLSDHSNIKRLSLFEMSKGLWFISLFPPPDQRLSLEPLGYILCNMNNTESSDYLPMPLLLLLIPTACRGIKHFHYGLWYCLWYTERDQHRLSRSLFMARLWNFDVNY